MKSVNNTLYNLILCFIFLLCCGANTSGQEKVNISTGIGFPELINLVVYYQHKQIQAGLGFGFYPESENNNLISAFGDIFIHFAGSSELSNRRPWYGRVGLNYLRDENKDRIWIHHYLNLRFGRDFNISKKIGINIDGGVIFEQFSKIKYKESSGGSMFGPISFPLLPSVGIGLFYRI